MMLPIDDIKESLLAKLGKGNVVITSPTGSGKSTRVPIWAAAFGRVLVVEPRRVACRALATYLASKNNEAVGDFVGYQVRGERRLTGSTRVSFVTPGIALGILSEPKGFPFDVVIIDEYHERSMELDLLLALCLRMGKVRLAVMSATIDGERIAHHVDGVHVEAKGRSFPIDVDYLGPHTLPTREALVERVLDGLLMLSSTEGDILVFLPGKQEIEKVRAAIQRHDRLADYACLPLHSQLSLDSQAAVFKSGARRRIILSTNVAEASVTVPRVRAVVDTGLVRQTLYRGGRGYLTLTAISQASADQRAGRAGRVGPGVCIRLWSRAGRLAPKAKPEILRESASWMVLRAASFGWLLESLPLLDQPPAHSLVGARQYLSEIGAIDESGLATSVGRAMTQLPVDLSFARWLVAAQQGDCLSDMIALVSTLSTRRHYLRPGADLDDHPVLETGCDAAAIMSAKGAGQAPSFFTRDAFAEACEIALQLESLLDCPKQTDGDMPSRRRSLAKAVMACDPGAVYVRRLRKSKESAWYNGKIEALLDTKSLLALSQVIQGAREPEALLALSTHAYSPRLGRGGVKITAAMPVPLSWVADAGLGREVVKEPQVIDGALYCRVELQYGGRVVGAVDSIPSGLACIQATVEAVQRGVLWHGLFQKLERQVDRWLLACSLESKLTTPIEPLTATAWLMERVKALGLTDGTEITLLSSTDLDLPDLPERLQERLERHYPDELRFPDATYRLEYQVKKNRVTLVQIHGQRTHPPPLNWLPRFKGFAIYLATKRGRTCLRARA